MFTDRPSNPATTVVPRADAGRTEPMFSHGQIIATAAVCQFFIRNAIDTMHYLRLHERGHWGDVPPEDAASNGRAIQYGGRVLSSHQIDGGQVWIITEADRSSTCLLFPSEY